LKFLILGSEGFIGTHCVNYFLKYGFDVIGADLYLDRKFKNYQYEYTFAGIGELRDLLLNDKIKFIINAAGSGSVPFSIDNPYEDFKANCLDTFSILELIRQNSPNTQYLHISSAAVYGNPKQLPVYEDSLTFPLSPYGWHKVISENLCREYSSVYGLQTIIVRPFSVYGPGLKKQLLWDLFQKIKLSKEYIIELWGTGNESRDFIYIDDLIRGIHMLIDNAKFDSSAYNLGSGIETSINDVVKIFVDSFDSTIKYNFNGNVREGDPNNWRANISKMSSIGFSPEISLADGIMNYTTWLKTIKNE
jgi:UDP-glucose 4-epimerase